MAMLVKDTNNNVLLGLICEYKKYCMATLSQFGVSLTTSSKILYSRTVRHIYTWVFIKTSSTSTYIDVLKIKSYAGGDYNDPDNPDFSIVPHRFELLDQYLI